MHRERTPSGLHCSILPTSCPCIVEPTLQLPQCVSVHPVQACLQHLDPVGLEPLLCLERSLTCSELGILCSNHSQLLKLLRPLLLQPLQDASRVHLLP